MLDAFALVGEPDVERRDRLLSTLQGAGYHVRDCPSARLLGNELHDEAALSSGHLMIMAVLEFALVCSQAISALATSRSQAGRSRPLVVLLCEPEPVVESLPQLESCKTTVILLDTFDPSDLTQLAEPNPFWVQVAEAGAGGRVS
jgi:hypothetical protein